MLRMLLLVGLAACWHSTAPDPAPPVPTTPTKPAPVVDESQEPKPCYKFDARNPTCANDCPRDAPTDWPSCGEATRKLLASGYVCTSNFPWSCTPPAPKPPCPPAIQCQPVHARVIALMVNGSQILVTIAAGSNLGVTASWKATLVDRNQVPVAGGAVRIIGVGTTTTRGQITATADQLRNTPYVLLEP